MPSFNSKMVQLKAQVKKKKKLPMIRFQFQNGAIKRKRTLICTFLFIGFNSKMVQLKEGKRSSIEGFATTRFNSKMVQLKATSLVCHCFVYISFNSKMVQLKVFFTHSFNHAVFQFQFQNGAIKRCAIHTQSRRLRSFNSKMVQLKVKFSKTNKVITLVSIPKWCN